MAAFRATTPEALEAALRQAFALDAPALVHVPVGADAEPVGHDPAAERAGVTTAVDPTEAERSEA